MPVGVRHRFRIHVARRSGPILPRGLTDQVVARVTAASEYQVQRLLRQALIDVSRAGRNILAAHLLGVVNCAKGAAASGCT